MQDAGCEMRDQSFADKTKLYNFLLVNYRENDTSEAQERLKS